MANLTDKIKSTWYKCIETLGQSAANMADNAKQKLNEINMEARRKEVVSDLPNRLLQMWKDGVELPEELSDVLAELNGLEEELAAFRAARLAKKMKPAITDGSDAEPLAAETVEDATEEAQDETDPEATSAEATEEAVTIVFDEEEASPEAEVPAQEESSALEEEKPNDNPVAFDF
jgi:hypothetical protein